MVHVKHEKWLTSFVTENLCIEGIFREPTEEELDATWEFIKLDEPQIADLYNLVHIYQPDAVLRDNPSKRVWIGGREAPKGGLGLLGKLDNLLWQHTDKGNRKQNDPWSAHAEYEFLHPFTDGNGRSGRAFWANIMYKKGYDFRYNFLQMYYYQTLNRFSEDQTEST